MSNYKITDTAAYSYDAVIGRSFYVKGKEVWVVNTTYYSNTTAKHQYKLKQTLKDFIPIKTSIYALNNFIGDSSGLEALFNVLLSECNIENTESLKRIAQILDRPFDEKGFTVACKQNEIESLIRQAYDRKVTIPRWVKSFNPYDYAKLKTMNAQHKKGGIL